MLITQQMVDEFLKKIKKTFPNFIAGVLSDENGFPIASKIPKKLKIDEDFFALAATDVRIVNDFMDFSKYTKVMKEIGKKEKIKLLVLLKKSAKYSHKFQQLNEVLSKQSLF